MDTTTLIIMVTVAGFGLLALRMAVSLLLPEDHFINRFLDIPSMSDPTDSGGHWGGDDNGGSDDD